MNHSRSPSETSLPFLKRKPVPDYMKTIPKKQVIKAQPRIPRAVSKINKFHADQPFKHEKIGEQNKRVNKKAKKFVNRSSDVSQLSYHLAHAVLPV